MTIHNTDEIKKCIHFLQQQIDEVKHVTRSYTPKLWVVLIHDWVKNGQTLNLSIFDPNIALALKLFSIIYLEFSCCSRLVFAGLLGIQPNYLMKNLVVSNKNTMHFIFHANQTRPYDISNRNDFSSCHIKKGIRSD